MGRACCTARFPATCISSTSTGRSSTWRLATTVSKFLYQALALEGAIKRVTLNPSQIFGRLSQFGTVREHAEAEIAFFSLYEGEFRLTDALGATRTGRRMLHAVATVGAESLYRAASIPVERL